MTGMAFNSAARCRDKGPGPSSTCDMCQHVVAKRAVWSYMCNLVNFCKLAGGGLFGLSHRHRLMWGLDKPTFLLHKELGHFCNMIRIAHQARPAPPKMRQHWPPPLERGARSSSCSRSRQELCRHRPPPSSPPLPSTTLPYLVPLSPSPLLRPTLPPFVSHRLPSPPFVWPALWPLTHCSARLPLCSHCRRPPSHIDDGCVWGSQSVGCRLRGSPAPGPNLDQPDLARRRLGFG